MSLQFVPYAPGITLADPAKKNAKLQKAAAYELREREWLSEAPLYVGEAQDQIWADAKVKAKADCDAIVTKFVRYIIMRVSLGDSIIKEVDLKKILAESNIGQAASKLQVRCADVCVRFVCGNLFTPCFCRTVLIAASKPLKNVWGYEICPSVYIDEYDDAPGGYAWQEKSGEVLVRLATDARPGPLLGSTSERLKLTRERQQRHLKYCALYSATTEVERRGILTALLCCIARSSKQVLVESEVFRCMAESGDESFVEQAKKYQEEKGAGGKAGGKRAREEDGLPPPGGLPLKGLLDRFVNLGYLTRDACTAEEAGVDAAQVGPGEAGAGGGEPKYTCYSIGNRSRACFGTMSAVRVFKAVTQDTAELQREKTAGILRPELGLFTERIPTLEFDVKGKGKEGAGAGAGGK